MLVGTNTVGTRDNEDRYSYAEEDDGGTENGVGSGRRSRELIYISYVRVRELCSSFLHIFDLSAMRIIIRNSTRTGQKVWVLNHLHSDVYISYCIRYEY